MIGVRMFSRVRLLAFFILFTLVTTQLWGGEIKFANASFEEDSDENGVPDHWTRARYPIFDSTGLNSHSGSNSANVNLLHCYTQSVTVIGGAHYTFSHWAKAATDWDVGVIDVGWYRGDIQVGFTRNRAFWGERDFHQYLGGVLAPLSAERAIYVPRSGWMDTWLWVDDCTLYNEFVDNGSFEGYDSSLIPDGWQLVGSPVLDCSGANSHSGQCAILVDNANYLFQDLAATAETKTYLLAFWARAAIPVTTWFNIDWYDADAGYLSSYALDFTATTGYQQFSLSIIPPANAVLGKLLLRPDSGISLWVDDVELDWHTIMPAKFSPNNDGIYDTTKIIYALNEPSTVTLMITEPSGQLVTILEDNLPKARSVTGMEWDGRDSAGLLASDGDYLYKIVISNEFSPLLIIQGDLQIDTSITYSDPVNQFGSFFPRGVWIYAGWRANWDFDSLFEDLSQHNLNAALLDWIQEERYDDALYWGEQHGIKCILRSVELNNLIQEYQPYQALPEEMVRNTAEHLAANYSSYDSLLGYYVIDEPSDALATNVLVVNTILNSVDPAHPGFSSISDRPNLINMFEIINPAVLLHHKYPVPISSRARPGDFDRFCQNLDGISTLAQSKGLPFWMVLQAFSATSSGGIPVADEIRCMTYLALAYGAKGVFYFIYQSLDDTIGLVYLNFSPTENYLALAQILGEVKSVESLLLNLRRAPPIAQGTNANCLVNTFIDAASNYYLMVVNKDCMNPSYTRILLNLTGLSQIRDVRGDYPLAFYEQGSQTYFDLELLPGDGRIIELR